VYHPIGLHLKREGIQSLFPRLNGLFLIKMVLLTKLIQLSDRMQLHSFWGVEGLQKGHYALKYRLFVVLRVNENCSCQGFYNVCTYLCARKKQSSIVLQLNILLHRYLFKMLLKILYKTNKRTSGLFRRKNPFSHKHFPDQTAMNLLSTGRQVGYIEIKYNSRLNKMNEKDGNKHL